jgi:hypothetical protein
LGDLLTVLNAARGVVLAVALTAAAALPARPAARRQAEEFVREKLKAYLHRRGAKAFAKFASRHPAFVQRQLGPLVN